MTDLREYGLRPEDIPQNAAGIPGRVTAVHKERYAVVSSEGERFARLKKSVYFDREGEPFPTVGDFVLLLPNPEGDWQIVKTLPRRTFFSRLDPYPGRPVEQAVAANFDLVLLVQSLNENFSVNRLERYLIQARQSGARPLVVLTKADLPGDHTPLLKVARETAGDAPVLPVSARTGEGISDLREYLLPGSTLVLLGSSGVGKSSLINCLAGEELMATGEIRERDAKGRHTTTHRQLLRLPWGALVIDTPGMRELGLWDASNGLRETFPDVEALTAKCRFRDCRHENEPGCAVREALRTGELSPQRWARYEKLQKELRFLQKAAKRKKSTAK